MYVSVSLSMGFIHLLPTKVFDVLEEGAGYCAIETCPIKLNDFVAVKPPHFSLKPTIERRPTALTTAVLSVFLHEVVLVLFKGSTDA